LAVAEARFSAEALLGKVARGSEAPDSAREGYIKERQTSGHADLLRLSYACGRREETIPWTLFSRGEWSDDGTHQQLTLVFSHCIVTVVGEQMQSVRQAHNECQLKAIEEHSEREIEVRRGENADLTPDYKKPIIRSITVEPSLDEAVSAIRGEESHETGHA
jgi:hypothetical protein